MHSFIIIHLTAPRSPICDVTFSVTSHRHGQISKLRDILLIYVIFTSREVKYRKIFLITCFTSTNQKAGFMCYSYQKIINGNILT